MAKGRIASLVSPARLVVNGFVRLLWPPVCQNCGSPVSESEGALCESCWDDVLRCTASRYCPRCGRDASPYAIHDGGCQNCLTEEVLFDGIARAAVYDGVIRNMIIRFKAADRTDLDEHFRLLARSAFAAAPFAEAVEFLVPVPLHWTRRLTRGYNQALLIARLLDCRPARISTELVRIKRTRLQPELTPAQRARNVHGAFAVRRGHPFKGRAVCLVDDVKTTGATLNECARVLKGAGAGKVFALVIAVAGQLRE